jgi:hypothetical protein
MLLLLPLLLAMLHVLHLLLPLLLAMLHVLHLLLPLQICQCYCHSMA